MYEKCKARISQVQRNLYGRICSSLTRRYVKCIENGILRIGRNAYSMITGSSIDVEGKADYSEDRSTCLGIRMCWLVVLISIKLSALV
jgi:hypothetical protein